MNSSSASANEQGDPSPGQRDGPRKIAPTLEVAAMPDTGMFYVLDIDAVLDEQGRIACITSLAVQCPRFTHVTRSAGADLESTRGGTVLACGKCGARQMVSNARLVECDHILSDGGPAPRAA